jgi:hypothetical protein
MTTNPTPEANEKDAMKAAREEYLLTPVYPYRNDLNTVVDFESGWKARAALDEKGRGDIENYKRIAIQCAEAQAEEIKALEAQLAEKERECDEYKIQLLVKVTTIGHLRSQLAARSALPSTNEVSEVCTLSLTPDARIKELEEYMHGHLERIEDLEVQFAEKDARIKDLEARCGMFNGMHAAKSEALIDAKAQLAARSAPAPAPDGVRRLILEKIKDDGECDCGFDEPSGEGYAGGICFLHEALLLLEPR